jgi:hypothetical protein
MHFIENATTGSQNIIISQGTGSNVTIPAGDVKAVYLDGAGSGAAVADAFTDLNLAGTTTVDALNVSGALTGSSTIQGTTITATTAFVPDASDGAALGTSSLEFSDLFLADAAVINLGDDQDTTLTHVADTGILLKSTRQLQFGDSGTYIHQSADGVLDLVSDTELELNATTIDINGNADISGTLGVTGAVTADAGVSIDNITIDGTEIDLSSGDLTIDVAGDIVLDAGDGDVIYHVAGADRGRLTSDSNGFTIRSDLNNGDLIFKGVDGGSEITALTFDMSAAGEATFNAGLVIPSSITHAGDSDTKLDFNQADTMRLITGDVTAWICNASSMVINEDSVDFDFRVESNAQTHAFFVDGGNSSVSMGTTPPSDTHSGWNQVFVGTRASLISENATAVSGLDGTWLTDNMYVDSDTGAFAYIVDGASSAVNQNSGDIKFFSQGSGSAGGATTLSQKMIIDGSGRVGIGESAPSNAKLEVLQAGDHDAHSTHGIAIHSTGNTNFTSMYMGCEDGIDSAYIQSVALDGSFTSKSLLLNPNGGQVKIGTNATNTTAGLRVDLDTSTTNIGALIVNNPNSSASRVATFNTGNNSATIIAFDKDFAAIGSISNSSGTVSYNAFMGSHYTESPDNLSSVLKGTVMETIDDLVTEKYAEQKRLTKCKVSDTSESNCVYGVWLGDTENNLVAAIGASWCRVNSSITVTKGDLLVSNGDGTAKVQSDDIIRSKTIGKVTSNVKTTTYSDGSYLVPVVLYCG